MNKTLLSVKQAAEKLQLCEATIRDYLKTGLIKGTKIGLKWRIDGTELDRLIEAGCYKS